LNKKDYSKAVADFGLGLYSWLKVLPLYNEKGNPVTLTHPVPIVHYSISDRPRIEKAVKAAGFHFAWSTLHYVPGYHIPAGHEMRALVKDVA